MGFIYYPDQDGQRVEKAMVQHIEYNRALLQEIVGKLKKEENNSNPHI